MKKYNAIDMKGRLYDYNLEATENKKGDAVMGSIKIEVDADGTVAELRFYVNEMTNAGKKNRTFDMLTEILAGNYRTVVNDGDEASWLALTGSIDVSYFKGRNNTDGELARSQKIRGGFINDNKDKKYCNKWKLDYIITDVTEIEADEEKQLDRFVKLTGFLVDDYNERLMEVQVEARAEKAIEYILGNISPSVDNPYFVSTWGVLQKVSRLVVKKNAFGEDEKEEYDSTKWAITGMNPEPYDIGDEAVLGLEVYEALREALAAHKEEKLNAEDEDGDSGKPALAF